MRLPGKGRDRSALLTVANKKIFDCEFARAADLELCDCPCQSLIANPDIVAHGHNAAKLDHVAKLVDFIIFEGLVPTSRRNIWLELHIWHMWFGTTHLRLRAQSI